MGSPEFAVPILESLYKNYNIVGVVTQPDKQSGRGKVKTSPPVKIKAEELGLDVFQPIKLRDPENVRIIRDLKPDIIVVAAFGQILKKDVLEMPEFGCINVHASLLPRWRGAAPIQAAILTGDKETGVSIMKMNEGVDTGPVYSQRKTEIHNDDNSESLSERLAVIGAALLDETLPLIINGRIEPSSQKDDEATYIKMLKKDDGLLDLTKDVNCLERQVRAYDPWPGTFINWRNTKLIIHKSGVETSNRSEIGKRTIINKLPAIGAGGGWLLLKEVQIPGKKRVDGKAFLNGVRDWDKN